MSTYHGNAQLKADFLAEIAKHEAADALVQGTYGAMNGAFRGCAVGCSIAGLNVLQGKAIDFETGDHARLARDLGVPLWLAHLEDRLFEGLPVDQARQWPRQLAEAIPVGVEIPDVVLAKLLRWTLSADRFGVRHTTDDAEVVAIIDRMTALFDRAIAGDEPHADEWEETARATWTAAGDARAAATRDAFYSALRDEVLRLLAALEPGRR